MRRLAAVIGAALVAAAIGPAGAQTASGVYRCVDSFNVPLGLLEVSGSDYSWTKTNASFEPVEAGENGSGTLDIEGPYFAPATGPLSTWGVTGAIAEGFININTEFGALMGCRAAG